MEKHSSLQEYVYLKTEKLITPATGFLSDIFLRTFIVQII